MISKLKSSIHPNEVLEAMLMKSSRPQRVKNLELLRDICAAQHTGSKDFSLPNVGRLCEAAGGLKARALYNAASADYRLLIGAWQAYSGSTQSKLVEPREHASANYLMRIDDPALRSLMQGVVIERDRLRAEVNMLKAVTVLQIDRRPTTPPAEGTEGVVVVDAPFKLTASEREALERAISQTFLLDEGWTEGPNGEIVNERGRKVYGMGYARAIRKSLKR